MEPKRIPISRKQYEDLSNLQIKRHKDDWWAVFSANGCENVWPFVCYGPTPEKKKQYVPLYEYPLLQEIAGVLVENVDEKGGRFFIDRKGVFFIEGEDETDMARRTNPEQFIEWKPEKTLPEERFRPLPNEDAWQPPPLPSFRELLKKAR
jgi:hypothetical protein